MVSSNWSGRQVQETIRANAAGDVFYTVAGILDAQGKTSEDSIRLYKITLGGAEGPSAAPVYGAPILPNVFEVNAAGDLYVSYPTSVMDPTVRTEVIPADGSAAYTVQGNNGKVVPGTVGAADENTFYVMMGADPGVNWEKDIKLVTKEGGSFVETVQTLTLADADSYVDFFRLADGGYTYHRTNKALVRLVADGALVATPTPVPLVGVDRVIGIDCCPINPVGGMWVFIAAEGAGYKFVRHNGTAQQDIPFDTNLDIRSFTASPDGAIDFLAVRLDTQEKVRGSVAAGATEVTTTTAGVLDPGQVVTFTRIN
jgi:hypothetical protein